MELHDAQPPVGVADLDAVDVGPGVGLVGDVSNGLAEDVVLVVHQDGGGRHPGLAVFRRPERQLGDAIELVFIGGDVVHPSEGREDPALVVRHVELPVLVLAGQPGADRPVHIAPVVVELLQRDAVPLP